MSVLERDVCIRERGVCVRERGVCIKERCLCSKLCTEKSCNQTTFSPFFGTSSLKSDILDSISGNN